MRTQWIGHAWRVKCQLIKEIITWTVEEKGHRERPRRRWIESINEI